MSRWTILPLLLLGSPLAAQEYYEVSPLNIRPLGEDFAPVRHGEGIVFCGIRETGGLIDVKDERTGKPLADMYIAKDLSGTDVKAEIFSPELNTAVNDGPATFARAQHLICYTRNQTVPKKLGQRIPKQDHLGLFFSERVNGAWTPPTAFIHNAPDHSVMHASLSEDGNTLYFASDMPGGLGGTDLYKCIRTAEGWGDPVNLGPEVNSSANELFPRLHPKGRLYFSSDREGGLGKLDIHYVDPAKGSWGKVHRMPEPVNSHGNDIGYSADDDDRIAYFSSDRAGLDMIFRAKRTIPLFVDCTPQVKDNYCYSFTEPVSDVTKGVPLAYQWTMGDGTVYRGHTAQHCFAGPGTYQVRLDLVDTITGDIFFSKATRELVLERTVQPYIVLPDTVRTGRLFTMDASSSFLPDQDIVEYQWDLGQDRIIGINAIHQFRTAGTYTVKLAALERPDANGRMSSSCVTRDIVVIDRFKESEDGVLVVYQDAYGKDHSFAYQELPFDLFSIAAEDGQDVLFSVRLFSSSERIGLNDPRFTEIRKHYPVIERYDPVEAIYTYSIGEAKNLTEMYAIYKKVKELRFMNAEVMVLESENLTDISELALLNAMQLNNTTVRTSNVRYATGAFEVPEEYVPNVRTIGDVLMENPELNVVIEAHTDAQGSEESNLVLSEKRAHHIRERLVEMGITDDRLIAIGFGENHPIASNSTRKGMEENRRVEFKLVVKKEFHAGMSGRP